MRELLGVVDDGIKSGGVVSSMCGSATQNPGAPTHPDSVSLASARATSAQPITDRDTFDLDSLFTEPDEYCYVMSANNADARRIKPQVRHKVSRHSDT